MFYFVDCDGRVQSDVYSGEPQMIEFGNACKDETYMKRRVQEIKLYNLLSNFAYKVNEGWEPDWTDFNEEKWYIYLSHSSHSWDVASCNQVQCTNEVYLKTDELAQKAIEEIIIPFERGEL